MCLKNLYDKFLKYIDWLRDKKFLKIQKIIIPFSQSMCLKNLSYDKCNIGLRVPQLYAERDNKFCLLSFSERTTHRQFYKYVSKDLSSRNQKCIHCLLNRLKIISFGLKKQGVDSFELYKTRVDYHLSRCVIVALVPMYIELNDRVIH